MQRMLSLLNQLNTGSAPETTTSPGHFALAPELKDFLPSSPAPNHVTLGEESQANSLDLSLRNSPAPPQDGINSVANTDKESLFNDEPISAPIDDITAKQPQNVLDLISDIDGFNWNTGKPLDPPPSGRFLSMDDLVLFCQKWGKYHGYAVLKSNSVPGKNVYITCD
ncbi:hypothetical protein PCANC_11657 [Puccinia coronata f. sp. avenae]|uniref:Uncharacterized protein n=1 Tax=Puccinia coronata f. sp. avenae TaxID=200324 RepID=A0A2N5VXL8_9BASI|nr:hypothetical protein PCANC_11657 [Puccinia coronata f. sp. avenae]